MPHIFDNINDPKLSVALKETLANSNRADFCVGYFNLRGWRYLANEIDNLSGAIPEDFESPIVKDDTITLDSELRHCRVLIGMPTNDMRRIQNLYAKSRNEDIDGAIANRLKQELAKEFRKQLVVGVPSNEDEKGLLQLVEQLRSKKVVVKLHTRFALHAKLYTCIDTHRRGFPAIKSYLGSSNLTFSGLDGQGELNTDVEDTVSNHNLVRWFAARWDDTFSLDITKELADIIETSWVHQIDPPYHIYLKMAYHLSEEAREGISEFSIPKIFQNKLFDYQASAVQIAARKLNKRGGVIIGDVVGLGKTMIASCLARIIEEKNYGSTLVICPPKLITMWEGYRDTFNLKMTVHSISKAYSLESAGIHKLVIIDESHNLRNDDTQRYRQVREYLNKYNDIQVVLLTATPYNKDFSDFGNQLKLFVAEDYDLGISPENLISSYGGGAEFTANHPNTSIRSLAAFGHSGYTDDWQELMRLFMVRRTRSFIKANYAKYDPIQKRHYLVDANHGNPIYFPDRIVKKVPFAFQENSESDIYSQLYSAKVVVDVIGQLILPRYGLSAYVDNKIAPNANEEVIINNLSNAGSRIIGYARSGLFKRLESSGFSFLLSIQRHIIRNCVFLVAMENDMDFPIGLLVETDVETKIVQSDFDLDDLFEEEENQGNTLKLLETIEQMKSVALAALNATLRKHEGKLHKWIRPTLFRQTYLKQAIEHDNKLLMDVMAIGQGWQAEHDRKLNALYELITEKHKDEKILIFTQFSDTALYLYDQVLNRGLESVSLVSGDHGDPRQAAQRFSPSHNGGLPTMMTEIRVLISTDVLSEGHNLQDAHIIVNFDLPWAIIRLIQRVGRVDRIGQQHPEILSYSFLPEEGVEAIINLRGRLRRRMEENAEIAGSDETFFEGDPINLHDLFSEKAGMLDDEKDDSEVDIASYAYAIYNNAVKDNPDLKKRIETLPNVSLSAKEAVTPTPNGVVLYTRTKHDNDVLTLIQTNGRIVSQSPLKVLQAAACEPDTPMKTRDENHHKLTEIGLEQIIDQEHKAGNSLGKKSGVRYKLYHSLLSFVESNRGTLYDVSNNRDLKDLERAIQDILQEPLRETAREVFGNLLKQNSSIEELAKLVVQKRAEGKLTIPLEETNDDQVSHIICSLGLV
jgi:superfamily II DNA or RNA helicase